jgi:molybdopterin-binding protein
MPTYKMGQAAELLGVSVDTVRRWADAGRIETMRSEGGHRLVDGVALAMFAVELASNHPTMPVTESARNHFLGLVTDVVTDGVMAHVKLQAGPFRISSLISSEAVAELGLQPGMLAVASVKATNVVIEMPPPPEPQPRKS